MGYKFYGHFCGIEEPAEIARSAEVMMSVPAVKPTRNKSAQCDC